MSEEKDFEEWLWTTFHVANPPLSDRFKDYYRGTTPYFEKKDAFLAGRRTLREEIDALKRSTSYYRSLYEKQIKREDSDG